MIQSTMERAKFLGYGKLQQLVADLYMQVDPDMAYEGRRSEMPEFGFIAWYLRTYFYIPMKSVTKLMGIVSRDSNQSSRAAKVVETYKASCMETPESLDGGRYDLLQRFKSIAAGYYYAPNNKPLDLCDDDEQDCLLYLAHLEIKDYDSRKRQGGGELSYKVTPEEPTLITLLDIMSQIEYGVPAEDLAKNYTIKSTY